MRAGRRKRSGPLIGMQAMIVLAVLGITAAIVKPRMSRGAATAAPQQADHMLVGHLRMLRSAILAYAQDHCGQVPSGDPDKVQRQLLQYTDISGRTSPIRRGPYMFGPYLSQLPPLPVGLHKGSARIAVTGFPLARNSAGWIYDAPSGMIRPNTSPAEHDTDGVTYLCY